MKPICFFNNFHNGDLFASKTFVKEIIDSVDTKFYYGHVNNPLVLKDLNVGYIYFPQISNKVKFLDTEDIFYINTWIGAYFEDEKSAEECCTLKFSYDMFQQIYSELNKVFSLDLKLSPMEKYFPFIDFSQYEIYNVDEYVKEDSNVKILFCNGSCLSGQCNYTGDMKDIIESLSIKYPSITFMATQKFDTSLTNIKFTSDIIQIQGCDLNEIGYLSTFVI